jgi:hypothetical protein
LGKALGWKESVWDTVDDGPENKHWFLEWHRFIDYLADGKSAESFFTDLREHQQPGGAADFAAIWHPLFCGFSSLGVFSAPDLLTLSPCRPYSHIHRKNSVKEVSLPTRRIFLFVFSSLLQALRPRETNCAEFPYRALFRSSKA